MNGVLLIELDGGGSVTGVSPLADSTTIRGLVINSFDSAGVRVGGNDVLIQGNYIGTDSTGLIAKPNLGNGINGNSTGFKRTSVGSSNPADRNVISGNQDSGITPNTGDDDWVIKGNYVGLGSDGLTQLGNSVPFVGPGGLSIDNCSGAIVGGPEVGATNVISGNKNFGIYPDNVSGLVIQGNIIGPDWKGEAFDDPVQLGGIGLPGITGPFVNTLIGGVNGDEGNLIAHNHGAGVAVVRLSLNGSPIQSVGGISILGNSIHDNLSNSSFLLSESGLGIDILDAEMSDNSSNTTGPTPNDPSDSDTGPNNFINFPILNSVEQNGSTASINFNLDAADGENDQYRVEFFSNDTPDPSGYGEGQTFLGATTVTNGNSQIANLTLPSGTNLADKSISATTTAIDSNATSGFGSTSEFSQIVTATQTLIPSPEPTTPTSSPISSTGNPTPATNLAATGDNLKLLFLIASLLLLGGLGMLAKKHLPRTKSYNKKIKNTKKK